MAETPPLQAANTIKPGSGPDSSAAAASSRYRICPLCEACCGLEVKASGGKVISIEAMKLLYSAVAISARKASP